MVMHLGVSQSRDVMAPACDGMKAAETLLWGTGTTRCALATLFFTTHTTSRLQIASTLRRPRACCKTSIVIIDIDGPSCPSSLAPAPVDVSDASAAFIRLKTGTSPVLALGDPSTLCPSPPRRP